MFNAIDRTLNAVFEQALGITPAIKDTEDVNHILLHHKSDAYAPTVSDDTKVRYFALAETATLGKHAKPVNQIVNAADVGSGNGGTSLVTEQLIKFIDLGFGSRVECNAMNHVLLGFRQV
ncbi:MULTISPECIES: hypothetical protein [Agrobacterium]|jgi:hypothetical protein|uniref:hypothetical protein n=1 Tax=Agrobacterium tumefaciens TaxID=358 RepID=UPI000410E90E